MDPIDKIANLDDPKDRETLANIREMVQYIGANTRPDVCAPIQLAASGPEETIPQQYDVLTKVIALLKRTKRQGLILVSVNSYTERLIIVSDALVANARDF